MRSFARWLGPALLLSCSPMRAKAPAPAQVPVAFVQDDAAAAFKKAREEKKLVFVDAWAAWCHSCKSMREFVLHDPRLQALDSAFVWLEIETERDANRAFVQKFPNRSWPTLRVIDPNGERIVLEWEGTATVDELLALLSEIKSDPTGAHSEPLRLFLEASRERNARAFESAEKLLAGALEKAPRAWAQRDRVIETLVLNESDQKDFERCVAQAEAHVAEMATTTTSYASVLATSLSCNAERKKEAPPQLSAAVAKFLGGVNDGIMADDRSSVFGASVESARASGDEALANATARRWLAFLTQARAKAATPAARSVFDAHLVEAAIANGTPLLAVPALEQSEQDFPKDYNPPARLARVYLESKRFDDARFAIWRAIERVYGPRALRIFLLAADIASARKAPAEEKEALDLAIARTENQVLSPFQEKLRAKAIERRNALGP